MSDKYLIPVENSDEVWGLPETETFFSDFMPEKNIDLDLLIHLANGKGVVDVSDGTYIHWLQFTDEAIEFLNNKLEDKNR